MWNDKTISHPPASRKVKEEYREHRKFIDSVKLGTSASIGVGIGYLGGPLGMLAGGAVGVAVGMVLSIHDS